MLERYRQNSNKVEQNSKILLQTVHGANTSGVDIPNGAAKSLIESCNREEMQMCFFLSQRIARCNIKIETKVSLGGIDD